MSIIAATDLVKHRGDLPVLRGVTLRVEAGEVAAIIGASGGGKSTFLRCLNGLDEIDGGSLSVDGVHVDSKDPARARTAAYRLIRIRAGMVFQSFNLFPHRSVLENVIEAPIHVLGIDRDEAVERARDLLERVGMLSKINAAPRTLSGGEQQRVAIARALAMRPRAMLFDEPTSALDPRMTAEVLDVIDGLAREGLTMLVVTHAMHFARRLAHTVHVFSDGRVVETGAPEQILEAPAHEATRRLLSESRVA